MPASTPNLNQRLGEMLYDLRERLKRLERSAVIRALTYDGRTVSVGRYTVTRWIATGVSGETFTGLAGSPVVNSETVTGGGLVKDPYTDYIIDGTTLVPAGAWSLVAGDVVLAKYMY